VSGFAVPPCAFLCLKGCFVSHFWRSVLIKRLRIAAKATFIAAPPFDDDGHYLFSLLEIPI
jgi:hypothetical protein